jgi:hypothetical protein
VVNKPITAGCITTAAQQHSLLLQPHNTLNNPRSAFQRDLTASIQASIAAGKDILLMGDFNEVFESDDDGMIKRATTCGLPDLMSMRYSSTPPATYARGRNRLRYSSTPFATYAATYARGRNCLDYALAINHVAEALSHVGYEPFNAKFPSDQRANFLDFDT